MTEKFSTPSRGFFFNGERTGRGMQITVGAVIAVSEITKEKIVLVSHASRVLIEGEGLELSVFEERAVEIIGKVREVKFLYGKN